MHLVPPEPENWEEITGFSYGTSKKPNIYPELDPLEALAEKNQSTTISLQFLKGKPVRVHYRGSLEGLGKYSVYSCTVFETDHNGRLYVLSEGDWHQVEKNWADGVRARVGKLASAGPGL
jgi:uncharacterized protein (TIGR04141 family)